MELRKRTLIRKKDLEKSYIFIYWKFCINCKLIVNLNEYKILLEKF